MLQSIVCSKESTKKIIDEHIIPCYEGKILDVGCRTADILMYLPKDIVYYGFDLSREYINSAKNKYGNRGKFFVLQ